MDSPKQKETKELLRYLTELSRIEISKDEEAILEKDIGRILDYVGQLQKVHIDSDMLYSVNHQTNRMREDVIRKEESLPIDKVEQMAIEFSAGHFVVPRVIDEGS